MHRLMFSLGIVPTCLLVAIALVACKGEPLFEWEDSFDGSCFIICYEEGEEITLLRGRYTIEVHLENVSRGANVDIYGYDFSEEILIAGEGRVKKTARVTLVKDQDYYLTVTAPSENVALKWKIAIYADD